mgnify:CR=1 FL=1
MRKLSGSLLGLMICATAAEAHPHMFIDTGIAVDFDADGRADGLRITWTYDELTSMQVLADMGLDMDMDGVMTDAELAQLDGFDMHWDEGIAGDTYAQMAGVGLPLSRPADWTIAYQNGRISSTHFRSFDAPVDISADPLLVKVYDETLYTGYYIVYDTTFVGRSDCRSSVVKPDLDAAQKKLQAAIAALPQDVEVDYPALGAEFAEGVQVTCGAPS